MSSSAVLQRIPFFADLPSVELAALEGAMRRRRYQRGSVVFQQGDPGSALYVVESGTVKIALTSEEGKEVILTRLGPGDFFGELALLDGEPRSADAVAMDRCELLMLPRDSFVTYLSSHPAAAVGLLVSLTQHLRRLTQFVHDSVFLDVPGRLANALLQLAELSRTGAQQEPQRITQADLAAMVGATRESINKWLGFYEQQGLIRRSRGSVLVLKPDELRRRIY